MIKILGLPRVLSMSAHYGGQTIFILQSPNPDLEAVIGRRASARLAKKFGGEKIYIPKCIKALHELRNRQIIDLYSGGVHVNDIAAEFDLSDRRIWKILSMPVPKLPKHKAAPKGMDRISPDSRPISRTRLKKIEDRLHNLSSKVDRFFDGELGAILSRIDELEAHMSELHNPDGASRRSEHNK